ncbi:MAG: pantoate--beta-alanine ligase [Planctomycetota bacterium]
MRILHTISEVRECVAAARKGGTRVGFVPTMGALHAGHGSLIARSVAECGFTVVSIFVNPTQFAPTEDLDKYPRTLDADAAYCEKLGADLIFAPSAEEMYPDEQLSWVDVEKLTDGLCGAARPGHFRGVTTVCAKLFNIVGADIAYFGQKDAQQAMVIKRMVADLNMPLEICVCPIVREADGLAMSSRNRYLSSDERKRALCLSKALAYCQEQVAAGERNVEKIEIPMMGILARNKAKIEYVRIVDPDTLEQLEQIEDWALVLVAAYIGKTRLIDNLLIGLNDN